MDRVLRMGMVGGGRDAFIGMVHRTAACLDNRVRFTAGCLSSTPEKALASGSDLGLDARRNYPSWEEMLRGELALPTAERIDFVSIVTPNHVHFPVAQAFAKAGIHVVCDKPLVHTSRQARELAAAVKSSGVVFAVTYNYSGYPLVKQARDMVVRGEIGEIRKVIVEYNQGWLASNLESTGQKQADWRTDPARSGLGGAIGDIGSHAEQLTSYITGLELDSICADLTTFVAGRRLDDDANLLLRFRPPPPRGEGWGGAGRAAGASGDSPTPPHPSPLGGGGPFARGILTASQIEIGHENDLRIRVFGASGTLEWRQENPNELFHRAPNQPERALRRGNGYLCDAAKKATRIPAGHPEAFLEAFANIYNNACDAIRASAGGLGVGAKYDFPDLTDGARGVHFIEKTVESSASDRKWTAARFEPLR